MKLEPLKDKNCKILYTIPQKNGKIHTVVENRNGHWFRRIDIKSAVEWLKKELSKGMSSHATKGKVTFNYLFVGDTIDKAFEDVTKKKKNG